jgi:hypothetical protein
VPSAWTTGPSDPIMGRPIRADPGQKQDPAKVTTCAPTPSKFSALLVPGLCPVSIKGIQAALRAARTLP